MARQDDPQRARERRQEIRGRIRHDQEAQGRRDRGKETEESDESLPRKRGRDAELSGVAGSCGKVGLFVELFDLFDELVKPIHWCEVLGC